MSFSTGGFNLVKWRRNPQVFYFSWLLLTCREGKKIDVKEFSVKITRKLFWPQIFCIKMPHNDSLYFVLKWRHWEIFMYKFFLWKILWRKKINTLRMSYLFAKGYMILYSEPYSIDILSISNKKLYECPQTLRFNEFFYFMMKSCSLSLLWTTPVLNRIRN